MQYIGAKTKLLDWIFYHANKQVQELGLRPHNTVFMDACSGSGAVTVQATLKGFKVVANDLLCSSCHVARGKTCLPSSKLSDVRELLQTMNYLSPVEGHFFREYSLEGGRMYFTVANAKKIDAWRLFIQGVKESDVQSYLYYCLIEAISRVANTVGVQNAYLKSFTKPALQEIYLKEEPRVWVGGAKIYNQDILDLLGDSNFRSDVLEEVLYIDPPYVSREYASLYHLYEAAVAAQDPVVQGVTGMPANYLRSDFCSTSKSIEVFLGHILEQTRAQLVVISYSSDGTIPLHQITSVLLQKGCEKVEVQVKPFRRYKSDASENREYNSEFLQEFLIFGRPTRREIFCFC